ncbi:MAG: hypothetical protein HY686_07180 [Chloroflexi bacterium]|nr:hypothetical protein [Chloroflexota bacterium]
MASTAKAPRGIIDSLASGYGLVTRKPWLLLLLVLLDILLWLVPGVRAGDLFRRMAGSLLEWAMGAPLTPDQTLQTGAQAEQLLELFANLNLLALLAWQVPALNGVLGTTPSATPGMALSGGTQVLGFVAGMLLLGLLLACFYFAPIGASVRGSGGSGRALARSLGWLWLRLAGYRLLLAGLLVAGVAVVVALSGVASALGPGALSVALGVLFAGGILLAVHLFLAEEAIILAGQGPARALAQSFRIVHRNFWPCLGLWALSNVISLGMRVIWERLAAHPAGLMAAILGNAYIATGLVAAVMVFYWDRRGLGEVAEAVRER